MPVSREVVEHVARLAHIGLEPSEVEVMTRELSSVIDHVGVLQRADIEGVPATAHVIPIENVMREDGVRPSWPPESVLINAPHRTDGFFEVQAVLE
jgi:aspartyl-tRNA(Asn)/glutamyl-tRNA(Gln) amidotransferase subunit C